MIFPGVGTAIGAALGSLVGGLGGSAGGSWLGEKAGQLYNWATGPDDKPAAPAATTPATLGPVPTLPAGLGAAPVLGGAALVPAPALPAMLGQPPALSLALGAAPVLGGAALMPAPVLPGLPAAAPVPAPGVLASMDAGLGSVGSWLGDKLTGLVDTIKSTLGTPAAVSKEVAQAQAVDSRQITFSPQIQITGADHASQQALAAAVMEQLRAQFMPMMTTDPLTLRRSASLTDGSAG